MGDGGCGLEGGEGGLELGSRASGGGGADVGGEEERGAGGVAGAGDDGGLERAAAGDLEAEEAGERDPGRQAGDCPAAVAAVVLPAALHAHLAGPVFEEAEDLLPEAAAHLERISPW